MSRIMISLNSQCAANFLALLNLLKGKVKAVVNPQLIPKHKHSQHTVWNILLYPSLTEPPSIKIK
jgi:hypothetical protein